MPAKGNMQFRKYCHLCIIILSLLIYSCKDEIVTPNDNKPGRRDYVWSIDTISNIAPNNYYYLITGSSINNLWIAGEGDNPFMYLLHFDGKKWTSIKSIRNISPFSMYCFNNDSTWFGEMGGQIWQCKNNVYTILKEITLYNYESITLEDMWTDEADDVFMSGFACEIEPPKSIYGIILEYKNKEWQFVYKPEIKTQFLQIRKAQKTSTKLYVTGAEVEQRKASIYEYDYRSMKKIFTTDWDHVPHLITLEGQVFFYFEGKLHSYIDNSFQKILDFTQYQAKWNHINGRNLSDLFIGMEEGIGHFNGKDVKLLLKMNDGSFINSILFDDGIAIIYYDNIYQKYYVVRGKLK